MRPPREIRATDALDAADLARLPVDVRDLVERAAWRVDVEAIVWRAGGAESSITLTPNPAAVELMRRAEAARTG